MRFRVRLWAVLAVAAMLIASCASDRGGGGEQPSAGGFNAEQFFAGKTIRVIVTHSAGGGSDLYGRFIADRLGDHIPGKPRVTVTNVSGLGGMSEVFDAPADQLVIGVTSQGSALYTTALDPAATFDATKIRIIGGTGGDPRAVTLFGDAAKAPGSMPDWSGKPAPELKFAYTVGAPVDLVSDSFFVSWLCDTMNLPCHMVSVADDDSTDLNLMMDRGEINALSSTFLTPLRDYPEQLADKSTKIAFQFAEDENTELTPPQGVVVPNVRSIIAPQSVGDYERILPIVGGGSLGKHYWAGPALSDDVLEALQTAYTDVVEDPAIVEDLQKVMSGDEGDKDGGVSYKVSAVSGADGQKLYEGAAQSFAENTPYYEDLQQKFYDKYWK